MIDVGDFDRVLTAAEISADIKGFHRRKKESEANGRLRGLGLCYYIESILGDPSEEAKVVFEEDGDVKIFVGTQSNGQGHETVFAQFLSDQTGIPTEKITVIQGDSDLIPNGGGTGGSRSVTVQNNATLAAVEKVIQAFSQYLSEKLGVDVENIEFDGISFRINGSNYSPNVLEVANMACEDQRFDQLTINLARIVFGASLLLRRRWTTLADFNYAQLVELLVDFAARLGTLFAHARNGEAGVHHR